MRGVEHFPERPKERYLSTDELARLGDVFRRAETVGLPWAVDEGKPTAKHLPKGPRLTRLDAHAVGAIRLLILTGARLREILHAKWEYVDWGRGLMHLPDSKTGKKTLCLPSPALGAGASLGLPIIGKLLEHTQPATTARYAHLDANPMRRAANLIGNQITAAMDRPAAPVVPLRSR